MRIAATFAAFISALCIGHANAAGTVVFAGISSGSKSTFTYLGGVRAMNGDLFRQGALMRGMISYGKYDYDTTAVAGNKVNAKASGIELGVGYQWVNPGNRFSIYGGIDYQDHALSPNDPINEVNGSKTGAAIQAEFETLGSPWHGSVIGKYSGAYDTIWARGRVGYSFGAVTIGPEAIHGANKEYKENRYGLFLNVPVSKATALSFSAGHRKSEGGQARSSQSGSYLGANLSANF